MLFYIVFLNIFCILNFHVSIYSLLAIYNLVLDFVQSHLHMFDSSSLSSSFFSFCAFDGVEFPAVSIFGCKILVRYLFRDGVFLRTLYHIFRYLPIGDIEFFAPKKNRSQKNKKEPSQNGPV